MAPLTTVTSGGILDGTIVNADVNASAAIAGTKVAPDFGSQNIDTTGHILLDSDSNQLKIGDGEDLKLFHNGTRSKIENLTGDLRICSNAIQLKNYDDDETYITCADNGAVELYYDNSKKFETTSSGVSLANGADATTSKLLLSLGNASSKEATIQGISSSTNEKGIEFKTYSFAAKTPLTLTHDGHLNVPDSSKIQLGGSQDLQIYHNGGNGQSYIDHTGTLNLRSTGNIEILKNGGDEPMAKFAPDGSVELYYDNSKKLETTTAGVTVTGGIIAGGLTYPTSDGSANQVLQTNGSGTLSFATVSGGLNSDAQYNTVAGTDAGNADNWGTDAVRNSLYGYKAGESLTTGDYNVAIGQLALQKNTTASYNTAVGADSLLENIDGGGNTAVGMTCMEKNTSGDGNTAVGKHALWSNETGSYNTVVGLFAQKTSIGASNNVVIGYNAGDAMTSADDCTFIGKDAGGGVTSGDYNISVGNESMMGAVTGTANVNVGRDGLRAITDGQKNVNVGNDGNRTGTSASYNVSIGHRALFNCTANNNTAVGYQAGDSITSGSNLTCIGYEADPSAADATNEVSIGNSSVTALRFATKPAFLTKAWVNFDGSGGSVGTPNGEGNVDTITDNGTGDYSVTWDVDLPNDDYCFLGCAREDNAGISTRGEMVVNPMRSTDAILAGSVRFSTCNSASGTQTDCHEIFVAAIY